MKNYDEITYKIIGCAIKVYNSLGCGFQEVIYARALAIELSRAELVYGREIEQIVYYEGIEIGTRRVDFIVDGDIMVELKALTKLEDVNLAQALNYITAYNLERGY